MKKVLLTTTAIVGLSAPAFAADPTAVSDQPYFHHSHPMTWSGSMSITLTNPSSSAITTAVEKATKRDRLYNVLNGGRGGEEVSVGLLTNTTTAAASHASASNQLSSMAALISEHASYTLAAPTTAATVSAIEDVIDDFLGASHSEALDVLNEVFLNTATPSGSAAAGAAARCPPAASAARRPCAGRARRRSRAARSRAA